MDRFPSMVSRLRQDETDRALRLKRVRGKLVRGRSLDKMLGPDGKQALAQYVEVNEIARIGPDLRHGGEGDAEA
jgi:hypothetical protein